MQKKSLLSLILGIFLIRFASAQIYGGSLNLGSIFDYSSFIMYGGTFVIFFTLINFLLGKSVFKGDESKTTRAVISFAISAMTVYGFATKKFLSGFGTGYVGNFFVGDILPTIITIIFIAGIVFFIWKWGFSNVLMVLGALSIIISLTNLAYEKNVFLVLGIILLVIGLLLKFRKWRNKRKNGENLPPGTPPQQQKIIYEQRQRSVSEMQQKLNQYKFIMNNPRTTPFTRRRMLRVMYKIERRLRRLGKSVPGQSVSQIEAGLRARRWI